MLCVEEVVVRRGYEGMNTRGMERVYVNPSRGVCITLLIGRGCVRREPCIEVVMEGREF